MYHLLWDIIPPIDRQYTIRFFFDKSIDSLLSKPKGKSEQFELFWDILIKVKEIIESDEFGRLDIDKSKWGFDTTPPKIVDDLIMIFVKKTKMLKTPKK
tara:strand:- start:1982 stop:2278 length:297 start_codon:yes stop_codon:yes gene_type:complete